MPDQFDVSVGAGIFRSADNRAVHFPHRWTTEGVTVEADFTGAHLLHLAVAGCVLNDVYREAAKLDIELDGVRVLARGGFDTETWESTGVAYAIQVSSPASAEALDHLLALVDEVAEIPRAVRSGATVERADYR
jgi:uncharacterized OsmC-like protein